MIKAYRRLRWLTVGCTAYALGGCVNDAQLFDFARTEVARLIADIVGQAFNIFAESIITSFA